MSLLLACYSTADSPMASMPAFLLCLLVGKSNLQEIVRSYTLHRCHWWDWDIEGGTLFCAEIYFADDL